LSFQGHVTQRFEQKMFQAEVGRRTADFCEAAVGEFLHGFERTVDVRKGFREHKEMVGTHGVLVGVEGIEREEAEAETPEGEHGVHRGRGVASKSVTLFNHPSKLLNELRVDAVNRCDISKHRVQDLDEVRVTNELTEGFHASRRR